MGRKRSGPFQLSFSAALKIDFRGSRIASGDWVYTALQPGAKISRMSNADLRFALSFWPASIA